MPDKNLFESTVESLPSGDHRMRVWLALVGCFTGVERSLRRRFHRSFQSSLPRYDVLTALVQFPDGLTMGQLASKLVVTKGNVTGVVRRLQQNRYVRQSRSRADRRVQVVRLTAKGRSLWDRMHVEYRDVIEQILAGLSDSESRALAEKLLHAQKQIDRALQLKESCR